MDYLKTEEGSRRILAHFNGFHDGFIHKLILRSRDSFKQGGSEVTDIEHQLTGEFDVRIDMAITIMGMERSHMIESCGAFSKTSKIFVWTYDPGNLTNGPLKMSK